MEVRYIYLLRPLYLSTNFTQAVRWGVASILTDVTKTWLDLRTGLQGQLWSASRDGNHLPMFHPADYDKIGAQYGRGFLWTTPYYYTPFLKFLGFASQKRLEVVAGPFDQLPVPAAIKGAA